MDRFRWMMIGSLLVGVVVMTSGSNEYLDAKSDMQKERDTLSALKSGKKEDSAYIERADAHIKKVRTIDVDKHVTDKTKDFMRRMDGITAIPKGERRKVLIERLSPIVSDNVVEAEDTARMVFPSKYEISVGISRAGQVPVLIRSKGDDGADYSKLVYDMDKERFIEALQYDKAGGY